MQPHRDEYNNRPGTHMQVQNSEEHPAFVQSNYQAVMQQHQPLHYQSPQNHHFHQPTPLHGHQYQQAPSKEYVATHVNNTQVPVSERFNSYEYGPTPPPYQPYVAGPSHFTPIYDTPASHPSSLQSTRQPSPITPHYAPINAISSGRKLTQIIAIPATEATAGSAFLRAYPPVLQQYNISREQFLSFLDNVNRAAVASPPVQILGLAGNIVSMIPLHTAQMVGGAVNAASNIGTRVIAKSHTEMVLSKANKELFKPYGLQVQVAKLDAVAAIARMPILGPDGQVNKKCSILQPLQNGEQSQFVTAQERRLQALGPWIERLDLEELPELAEGSNFLSKMHASASERGRAKGEKNMMKDRGKAQKEYSKDYEKAQKEYEKKMAEVDRDQAKAERKRKERSRERELRKVEKKRAEIEERFSQDMGKAEKHRQKDDKEEASLRKLLFLIVTNADGRIVHGNGI